MSPNYFPEGVFSERPDLHQFRANWYGRDLAAMKEPSLFSLRTEKNSCVYRFLWLRSFHKPIAVRLIVNNDGSGNLISTVISSKGGYELGAISESNEKRVSAEDVRSFEHGLSNLCFWDLPSYEKVIAVDGAQWIIEAVKDGNYHVVDRWCPGGLYGETAFFLVELSGIKVDRIY